MFDRLKQFIASPYPWIRKSFVLYLFVFLLGVRMFDVDKMHMRILNSLLVPIDYLYCFSMGSEPFNAETFGAHVDYYKQLIRYVPYTADALGMLAYCYYHMGEEPRAIELYKKAIAKDSTYFWFHYNLGVIYFYRGDYTEALASFKTALNCNRQATLGFASNSKVLVYLGPTNITDNPLKKRTTQEEVYTGLTKNLKEGLRSCQEMIVLSYYHLKDYPHLLRWSQHGIDFQPAGQAFFNYYAGVGAYELGNYSAALGFFNIAIENDPEYKDVFYYLNLTLKAMGKEALAKSVWAKYELLDSLLPKGRRQDQRVYTLKVF